MIGKGLEPSASRLRRLHDFNLSLPFFMGKKCSRYLSKCFFVKCTLFCFCFFFFLPASKEDKERKIDPKLLFPVKEWFLGFLPGHTFEWDFVGEEEERLAKAAEQEMMPIHEKVGVVKLKRVIFFCFFFKLGKAFS